MTPVHNLVQFMPKLPRVLRMINNHFLIKVAFVPVDEVVTMSNLATKTSSCENIFVLSPSPLKLPS